MINLQRTLVNQWNYATPVEHTAAAYKQGCYQNLKCVFGPANQVKDSEGVSATLYAALCRTLWLRTKSRKAPHRDLKRIHFPPLCQPTSTKAPHDMQHATAKPSEPQAPVCHEIINAFHVQCAKKAFMISKTQVELSVIEQQAVQHTPTEPSTTATGPGGTDTPRSPFEQW